jgi:hypothetical protein
LQAGKGQERIKVTDKNTYHRETRKNSDTIQQLQLTLKTKASMNDVFLPIKCDPQQLIDLNFCQSTVPLIKTFLNYLRQNRQDDLNLPFYISLLEMLKGIVYWLLEVESDDYQDPFKCNGFPIKDRQKILRETRLIDLLIDCLIFPFETKIGIQYDELTSQHPITLICRLVYRILKHSVKGNDINKDYVAQWIDLFFKQAMTTTERNSFMAEFTIQELLLDNKKLLDTQIETSTIVSLVDLCLTQPKHMRFLELMSNLCSCNGQAIASN